MRSPRSWMSEDGARSRRARHGPRDAAGSRRFPARPGGIARSTIGRGLADLRAGVEAFGTRVRRAGGGRKPAAQTQPGLLDALDDLVQSSIRGDPEAPLRWVGRSRRHLSAALAERGFAAGQKLVGRLLRHLGFGLQANRKTREGVGHPDRDARFEHTNAAVKEFQAAGEPAISVDTKKKELVGDFRNGGRELRPKRQPEPVRVHDFAIPELGKAVPYGVYDSAADTGWVDLGITHDTAAFAVEGIRRWWHELGAARYPAATRLLITADCGGGNGVRVRLWKREPQALSDELGVAVTVCHLPPGTGRWNRIEHRLFALITQNWRGKPPIGHQVIVRLIADTTTDTGPTVACRLDAGRYEKGIKVSDAEMAGLSIQPANFHGEWNYTITPRRPGR